MKKDIRHLIIICFVFYSASVKPMQNLLDYIKTYGKPVAQKTVDYLLLTPRSLIYASNRYKFNSLLDKLYVLGVTQLVAPGYIAPKIYYDEMREFPFPLDAKENMGLIKSLVVTGYMPKDNNESKRIFDEAVIFHERNGKYNYSLIRQLAEAGIKQGYRCNIDDVLRDAVYHNQIEAVKELIAVGADVNRSEALHAAVNKNNKVLTKFLLEAGADVNVQHWYGSVIAHALINNNDLEIIELFLDAGANVEKAVYDLYVQINPTDSHEGQERKKAIQKLLEAHKKKYAKIAQEAIETQAGAPAEYRGAKEISKIVEGYL